MGKSRDKRYVFGPLIVIAALAWLVISSTRSNTLRAVPVGELRAQDSTPRSLVGQRLRVVGFVGHEPVRRAGEQTPQGLVSVARFHVTDEQTNGKIGGKVKPTGTLLVEYRDALPDTFRAGGPVQVDGVYTSAGSMRADHVFTKCPSKYEESKEGEKTPGAKSAQSSALKSPTEYSTGS